MRVLIIGMEIAMSGIPNRPVSRERGQGACSRCPHCGSVIAGRTVDGQCARCLLQLASDHLEIGEPDSRLNTTGDLPRQFGRYAIRRRLGQGTMGAVYLARDTELERLVAIKVPMIGPSSEAAVFERFQREVRASAQIRHPNICPVFDVGQIDGIPFMTMAFIEGRSLSSLLENQVALSVSQAVSLVRKLALAIHAAHQRGVVHRDLKPANIMIDQRCEPIVMDFGLARRRDTGDVRLTTGGAIVGTPAYMSPEQVAGLEPTEASDVYSLGVILYELVTGRLPFDGELVPLLNKIAREPPTPPSAYCQDVSPTVDHICLRALEKDPEARFQSADELARELTRFFVDEGSPDPPPESSPGQSATSRNSTKRELKSKQQVTTLVATGTATIAFTLLFVACFYLANKPAVSSPPQPLAGQDDAVNRAAPASVKRSEEVRQEDPLVNYVLGRYLCFLEHDWERGLQYLARGADETLQQLAKLDLETSAPGRTTEEMLTAADAWAAFAGQQTLASTRLAAHERATRWYEMSLDGHLDTVDRNRIEQWLRTIDGAEPHPAAGNSASSVKAHSDVVPAERFDPDAIAARLDAEPITPVNSSVATRSTESSPNWLSRFEQRCLDSLRSVGIRRQVMLAELEQLVDQRDVELPRSHLRTSAEYSRLVRLGDELADRIGQVNLQQGELLRMRALSESNSNRRLLDFQLQGIRRARALAIQRYDALTVEAKAARDELVELGSKMKAVNQQMVDWSERANQLIEEAFWSLEPSGSLSPDAYEEIVALLSHWLHTTEPHPAIITLRALAYCHCGQFEKAAIDAEAATRLDPSFGLAIAVQGYVRVCEGGMGEGIAELSRAIRLDGKQPANYLLRGLAYQAKHRDAAARRDFERVTALADQAATGHALLALQLAASPDDSVRDGTAAVAAAERACHLSQRLSWIGLAALAAAKAEVRDFDAAVEIQRSACSAASPTQRQSCELPLKLFEASQPYRLH